MSQFAVMALAVRLCGQATRAGTDNAHLYRNAASSNMGVSQIVPAAQIARLSYFPFYEGRNWRAVA